MSCGVSEDWRPSIAEIPETRVTTHAPTAAAVHGHDERGGGAAAPDEREQADRDLGGGDGDEQPRQGRVLSVGADGGGVDQPGADRGDASNLGSGQVIRDALLLLVLCTGGGHGDFSLSGGRSSRLITGVADGRRTYTGLSAMCRSRPGVVGRQSRRARGTLASVDLRHPIWRTGTPGGEC